MKHCESRQQQLNNNIMDNDSEFLSENESDVDEISSTFSSDDEILIPVDKQNIPELLSTTSSEKPVNGNMPSGDGAGPSHCKNCSGCICKGLFDKITPEILNLLELQAQSFQAALKKQTGVVPPTSQDADDL